MRDFLRPTRMEIDLSAIKHNYLQVEGLVGGKGHVMAVIKADAYNMGALEVHRVLREAGCQRFAVATPDEAVSLREGGAEGAMLVMGPSSPEAYPEYLALDVSFALYSLSQARDASRAALSFGKKIRAHLKVDTGMGRLGFFPREVEAMVEACRMPGLEVEGIFTHFSVADEDPEYTAWQFDSFVKVIAELEGRGIRFRIRHCCNSPATLAFPQYHLDMVRPGLVLYGMYPAPGFERYVQLKPCFAVKTVLASIKPFGEGDSIGYGRRYRVEEDGERIGVLPIGYADGFTRVLSGKGACVLVRGKRAPVVGNICMDQTMISLKGIPDAQVGDEVVILGSQGGERISPEEIASRLGTINYEVPHLFKKRVPRVYV